MSEIPLNRFEREQRVIHLYTRGASFRTIAQEVKMSFTNISKIIKAYDKKVRLQQTKKEGNQTKKLSLSSEAFMLYQKGKKIDEVKVLLDIPFKFAIRYWKQYLKSIGMFEAFEFYQEHSYDITAFLTINNFIKRNSTHIKDIANILMEAKTTANLQLRLSILKNDIERLQNSKNNYLLNQNTNYQQPLLPLGLPKCYYEELL